MVMAALLVIWAGVSLGCGILFADWLDQWKLPGTGYPLGFWFAQQGSIVVFVMLILAYCIVMNWLDRLHHEELERIVAGEGACDGGRTGSDVGGAG